MSRGRASGKVILLGEHAVVYGVPALAAAIDRGATATAAPTRGPSTLRLDDLSVAAGDAHEVGQAFAAVLTSLEIETPVAVEASTDLLRGAGLGCSAALGVAIARAVSPFGRGDVLAAAHAWECVFHGTPSGVDAAVAASGGCVRFVRGQAPTPVRVARPLSLAIVSSGSPSATRDMVERVAELRRRSPALVGEIFARIATLVGDGERAIAAGELATVGRLLDENHERLSELGLSTPSLEDAIATARATGALGAKLTGAGGGGCAIALARDRGHAQEISDTCTTRGWAAFVAEVRS